jgi:hypothetical protein
MYRFRIPLPKDILYAQPLCRRIGRHLFAFILHALLLVLALIISTIND